MLAGLIFIAANYFKHPVFYPAFHFWRGAETPVLLLAAVGGACGTLALSAAATCFGEQVDGSPALSGRRPPLNMDAPESVCRAGMASNDSAISRMTVLPE